LYKLIKNFPTNFFKLPKTRKKPLIAYNNIIYLDKSRQAKKSKQGRSCSKLKKESKKNKNKFSFGIRIAPT
jgi:hypothetical protein